MQVAVPELLTQAEAARRLGVTRNYINQLTRDPLWPEPAEPGRWTMPAIREFLRHRLLEARPGARYCSTCGGELGS